MAAQIAMALASLGPDHSRDAFKDLQALRVVAGEAHPDPELGPGQPVIVCVQCCRAATHGGPVSRRVVGGDPLVCGHLLLPRNVMSTLSVYYAFSVVH